MGNTVQKSGQKGSTKRAVCPLCGSRKTAEYLYGLPHFSEELQKELDEGSIKLGGCCLAEDNPEHYCHPCGKDF